MRGTWAPERFVSSRKHNIFYSHLKQEPPFHLANLIPTSPVCLPQKSCYPQPTLLAYISALRPCKPTQQPESTAQNCLEQKPRSGDFSGTHFSQDEIKMKPWFGEARRQHSKVEDSLKERRGEGQRSFSLGAALVITAAI